jgi:multiple sugar transport system substrate-binding protein
MLDPFLLINQENVMKNTVALAVAVLAVPLTLVGCTGVGKSSATPASGPASDQKVTLTVWSAFSDRELKGLGDAMAGFHALHPNITIKNVGNQDDDKITQSVRGGTPPDVAISFTTDNIGQYCSSGSFQDLTAYITRDKVDLSKIPQATREYTSYKGKRCAMPLLADVYGLYYNKAMFAKAGISSPPKTMSEFAADAKKLTQYNSDGSIKVAGYVPTPGFYENTVQALSPQFGAQWQNASGKSAVGSSAGWSEMLKWQRSLTDAFGKDKLAKFTAAAGQEYSAANDFETGKIAMIIDGEYRTAFINAEAKSLDYGTAPFPVADSNPGLYGTAYTTGTIVGIPKGAKNAGAAWQLIDYLATQTTPLVKLANLLNNVPTSTDALSSPDLKLPAQFDTFLTLYNGGKLQNNPPSPNGGAYIKVMEDFDLKYVSGGTSDLSGGLKQTAQQIDADNTLGQ